MKSVAQFRLIDFILAMTVYLKIRHSHCTRARITVLVPCSRQLAVHLYSIAWPNLGMDFSVVVFIAWEYHGSLQVTIVGVSPHVADLLLAVEHRYLGLGM